MAAPAQIGLTGGAGDVVYALLLGLRQKFVGVESVRKTQPDKEAAIGLRPLASRRSIRVQCIQHSIAPHPIEHLQRLDMRVN